jgi:steroid delta-isomerase-like uncharacterized protein
MSTDRHKAIYRQFIQEAFNEARFDHLDALVAPDYFVHDRPPGTPNGREAIPAIVSSMRTAFPDFTLTIEELVAEGDVVSARSTFRGTHRGPIFGVAATGRPVEVTGLTLVRFRDGQLVESWVRNDQQGLLAQLGVDPSAAR